MVYGRRLGSVACYAVTGCGLVRFLAHSSSVKGVMIDQAYRVIYSDWGGGMLVFARSTAASGHECPRFRYLTCNKGYEKSTHAVFITMTRRCALVLIHFQDAVPKVMCFSK